MEQVLAKCSKRVLSDISKLKRKGLGRNSRNLDADNVEFRLETFNEKVLDLGALIEKALKYSAPTRLLVREVENNLAGFEKSAL